MTNLTLSLKRVDEENGISKEEMKGIIARYLGEFPTWDVSFSGTTLMKDARVKRISMNYVATIGQAQVTVLRIEFFDGVDLVIGGLAIHIDWQSLHHVELVGEHGESAKIIFRLGIDQDITMSCPTI